MEEIKINFSNLSKSVGRGVKAGGNLNLGKRKNSRKRRAEKKLREEAKEKEEETSRKSFFPLLFSRISSDGLTMFDCAWNCLSWTTH